MLKNIYATLLCATLLSTSINTVAQSDIEASEQEARTVLNNMASKTKSYNSISIKFSATLDNKKTNQSSTTNGTLLVKGDKYVLDINDMVTYYDTKSVSVWQKNNNELDISDPDPDSEGDLTPSKILGSYNEGYKLRMLDDNKINNTVCTEIDLYPTNKKNNNIIRLRLSIDKKTLQLKQFFQQNKNGTTLTVLITSFDTSKQLSDNAFQFDAKANPDVEIVDLR